MQTDNQLSILETQSAKASEVDGNSLASSPFQQKLVVLLSLHELWVAFGFSLLTHVSLRNLILLW